MCGIVGLWNERGDPVSEVILRRMTATIAHRGPDGEGHLVDGRGGLGHRRLAIIDPTPAGHQPMVTPDGRYALSFNGEIYNFGELRAALEAAGQHFRSASDTEVLLHALVAWGEGALDRLNGMFAFAFWDRREQTILLARDRYGIKPLYYCTIGADIAFASEIKALLAHPSMRTAVDERALLEYFTFQNIFTDATLFAGVRTLPAGCTMRIAPGRPFQIRRYWDYTFEEPDDVGDPVEHLEELDRLFRQAVNRNLVSDVDVAAYLSGGMDSGSITAIASAQVPNLRTFTVGFDLHSISGLEIAFDEREQAEHMSYLFGTEHYEMVLKAGDLERVMPRLIWHLEDLRIGQSYPNFYAAQLAGKFGKVVLAGTGGDEMFGGYPWRYYRAAVNANFDEYIDKYYAFWQRLIPNAQIRRVFEPVWNQVSDVWTRDILRDVFDTHAPSLGRPEDYINHSLYFEAKTFLHGLLLVEDKLSMAHGLESRVPFLDNDLVDFAQRLPVGLKLGNLGEVVALNENEPGPKASRFFERTRDGKLILRSVMNRYVPAVVTERVKQGFTAPDASWFRGESIDYVRRTLLDRRSPMWDYLSPNAVEPLVQEHLDGVENRRLLIWSLLSFDQWCRTFLDG